MRSIKTKVGNIFADSIDRYIYLALLNHGVIGNQDVTGLKSLIKPNMRILEIGANVGYYTMWMAGQVGIAGRILALEPERSLYECLKKTISTNKCQNVEIMQSAVSSGQPSIMFQRGLLNAGNSQAVVRTRGLPWRFAYEVPAISLEKLQLYFQPELVKMDIQGHEIQAMRGAGMMLQRGARPCFYFEFWPYGIRRQGHNPLELLKIFESNNYNISSWKKGTWHPFQRRGKLNDAVGFTNLLACPNEKSSFA